MLLVEFLTCHFAAVGSECNCYLSVVARWRSRHFTAVTALGPQHPKVVVSQNCLQWGRSNLVDRAGWPKIRLLNRDLGIFCRFFPGKTAKHRVH